MCKILHTQESLVKLSEKRVRDEHDSSKIVMEELQSKRPNLQIRWVLFERTKCVPGRRINKPPYCSFADRYSVHIEMALISRMASMSSLFDALIVLYIYVYISQLNDLKRRTSWLHASMHVWSDVQHSMIILMNDIYEQILFASLLDLLYLISHSSL